MRKKDDLDAFRKLLTKKMARCTAHEDQTYATLEENFMPLITSLIEDGIQKDAEVIDERRMVISALALVVHTEILRRQARRLEEEYEQEEDEGGG